MKHAFSVSNYDLAATLTSGQAFRWESTQSGWVGVVGTHWVRLRAHGPTIEAESPTPAGDWQWLRLYLQIETDIAAVLRSFPDDPAMRAAVSACSGLRLLRQDPWECLASFILSSTKQIVQIRQVVSTLCALYGKPLQVPPGESPAFAFPSPARLAAAGEAELRTCKMGFRAPFLLAAAEKVAAGGLDLGGLQAMCCEEARERLLELRGVGRKIADCVLLFAYGFQEAFPIDVWVLRALRQLYFRNQHVKPARLEKFAAAHFGPNSGYAQQYLFHYMRTHRPALAYGCRPVPAPFPNPATSLSG